MKMKNWFLLSMVIFTISCNTQQAEKAVAKVDSSAYEPPRDSVNLITDTHYFWSADWDEQKGMVMKKTTPITPDSLTASLIIQKLDKLYPEIPLRFSHVSLDTIFVIINKSTYLTQQIGTTGAESYLAVVTYNLTELQGINHVNFKFKAGDHASPDTYERTDF